MTDMRLIRIIMHNYSFGDDIMTKTAPSKELLEKIAAVYPTPFHVYSEAALRSRARALYGAFSWNKGYKEYYAVKACPNPTILKILKEEGCGVDCASYCELMMAEKAGFSGDEIMFSSNETPAGEFAYAHKLGAIINLDDITLIDDMIHECGVPERVCLRYNPGGEFKLGNFVMGNPGEAKYGMTKDQIFEAVRILLDKGVKRFALHAFLASNTTEDSYYPTNAAILMELTKELHETLGCDIFMINLSGGVGIPYRPKDNETDISRVGSLVKAEYDCVFGSSDMSNISISSELGRYMSGPAGWLVTRAIHEKHTYREYIGVDACAADLMRPAMYGAYHHITVCGKENAPCDKVYDVVGSLCENNDKFAINRSLPDIEKGDLLVIHDTGAHGYSMGYNYNGRLRSAEILIHPDDSFTLIRRAETPDDYFATFDIYPEYRR